ncbi:TlpA family protein disulfide reductase [Dyadobacter sp. OTU695]|uniref:TlpA family protein disulfide reductase n=1 Tax=Dyadobacter sp. OTU695 TaxID=3043860 RepID=UPI00313A9663
MRYSSYFLLLIIGILFQMTGCGQEKNFVRISITYPKAAGDTVIVGRTNMISLAGIELGKTRLDSAGKGTIEVEVDEPLFAYVYGKHMAVGLLIGPGDEVQILPSSKGAKLAMRFEGDGAIVNQIYNESTQLGNDFNKWNGTYAFRLGSEEFLEAKDSLQRSYDQLLAKLKSNKQVSAERVDMLTRQTAMHVIFYQYNFVAGKDSSEILPSVWKVVQKFPVDTIALKTGIYDYALIASNFYREEISNAIYEENEKVNEDTLESIFPFLVEKKIKASRYPKPIEDFLRVKSASIQIGLNGLTPSLHELAKKLEQEIPFNDFKSVIREDVARWEKIGPGKPAPDFAGITPDGKKLALSDLRGKVVYVDIWATWCGPCVGEFPDSRKVQAEFRGNDKIAFLFVSTDRDTLAWKKMVAAGKVPPGYHMLNGSDKPESVWDLYHVWGIPRYLLIDAQGRIVTTHAVRPSSGNVPAELRKLLANNPVASR